MEMIKQILQSAKRMSNAYHQKLASKKHRNLVFHNFKGYFQIIQSFVNGLKKKSHSHFWKETVKYWLRKTFSCFCFHIKIMGYWIKKVYFRYLILIKEGPNKTITFMFIILVDPRAAET